MRMYGVRRTPVRRKREPLSAQTEVFVGFCGITSFRHTPPAKIDRITILTTGKCPVYVVRGFM
jgi:hypothetical protein